MRWLRRAGIALVIVFVLAAVALLVRGRGGVNLVVTNTGRVPLADFQMRHLQGTIPEHWQVPLNLFPRYELRITAKTDSSFCTYKTGRLTRVTTDFQATIVDMETGETLASQDYEGQPPDECDSQAAQAEYKLTGTTELNKRNTFLYASTGSPETLLMDTLKDRPGLAVLVPSDIERSGVAVYMAEYDGPLDSYARQMPKSWKATGRPRYELDMTMSSIVIEVCQYARDGLSRSGTPEATIARVNRVLFVRVTDLATMTTLGEAAYEGNSAAPCPPRTPSTTGADKLEGDNPHLPEFFGKWLMEILENQPDVTASS